MQTRVRCAGLLILLSTGTAAAQSSEAERKVARELGTQGIAAYDQGSYAEAADKLERAYAVLKVPTLGLWSARALARTGKLVEASERYQAVIRMPLEADAPRVFREAKASAEQEVVEIEPRIPKLTVQIEGADAGSTEVTLDGAPVRSAVLGMALPVNPGSHQLVARAGELGATAELTLGEGQQETVKLSLVAGGLDAGTTAAPPADGDAAAASRGTSDAARPDADQGTGSTQRLAGYVTIGLGATGIVVGAITGFMVLGQKSSLDDGGCVDSGCPTALDDDREAYNSLRTVSTLGFVIGGVATLAGVTLLLTAPSDSSQVSLWVGPASAGLEGAF